MKKTCTALLLLFSLYVYGQHAEFKVYDNGLIYSQKTMKQLSNIVDSLNLKFARCELNRDYRHISQAKGHYVYLSNPDKEAIKDLKSGIGFEEFIINNPKANIERHLLISRNRYLDDSGKKIASFTSMPVNSNYGNNVKTKYNQSSMKDPLVNQWVFNQDGDHLSAFFITEPFTSNSLPAQYSRMVQYTNCMIDTATSIFHKESTETIWNFDKSYQNSSFYKFFKYVNDFPNAPQPPDDDLDFEQYVVQRELYMLEYDRWDSVRLAALDKKMDNNKWLPSLLHRALLEAEETGISNDQLEFYIGRYISKQKALDMKRSRRVIGTCSQDKSPRIHAMNIAVLAAESVSWDIFLRAHLDIMNDNFSRTSDGSYAWGQRQTYIRELEDLDINVVDLLLGVCLSIDDPPENHYYGSIRRIGRALTETKNSRQVENRILEIISDEQLDDYNRLRMAYLFMNYISYLADENQKAINKDRLLSAVRSLPLYIQPKYD